MLVVCLTVISAWTNGFSTFTIFSFTLKRAGDVPRKFPDFEWQNQDGSVFRLADKHKYLLVNFVYLDCPDVCHKVNNRLENIYHRLESSWIPGSLELVTISFDTRRDGLEKIRKYRNFFGKDIGGWSFALPYGASQQQFDAFLQKAGVWVYEMPATGLINHSVYLFLLSPDGDVIKIFDPAREDDSSIINQLKQWVTRS